MVSSSSSVLEEGHHLNAIHVLVKFGGYALILLSIAVTVVFYVFPGLRLGSVSNLFGAWAILAASATVSIWIVRKIYIEIKKRKIPDFNLTKTSLLFLRKHHILLGWATMMTATAHGVFYLLNYPNRLDYIYTGLIAWGCLALLMGFGAWLDYRLKVTGRAKRLRVYHFALASIFIVAMIVHA